MKKLIILSAMVASMSALYAQKDTATITFSKSKILIITDKQDTLNKSIVMADTLGNDHHHQSRHFNGRWAGIDIGLDGYLTPGNSFSLPSSQDYLELNQAKCLNISLNLLEWNIGIYKRYIGIVSGLGFTFDKYSFDKNVHISSDSTVLTHSVDNTNKYIKNKLIVDYLRMPLLLEFHIPVNNHKDIVFVNAGVIGALRIGSHIKQIYEVSGDKRTNKEYRDYFLSPLAYSAQVRVGYNHIGVFCEYQLSSFFKKDKGPSLYPWAAGLSLYF